MFVCIIKPFDLMVWAAMAHNPDKYRTHMARESRVVCAERLLLRLPLTYIL